MIKLKTEWTAENLKKYIIFTSLLGNKYSKLSLAVFAVCFLAIFGVCLSMFFNTAMPVFLILACAVALVSAGFALFFFLTVRKNIRKALANASESGFNGVVLTDDTIMLLKDNEPVGTLDWSKITRISFNDKAGAAYLFAEESALLILEYKNIEAGSEKELREMLGAKNDKLPKEA